MIPVSELLDEVVSTYCPDFVFRPNQRECVIAILDNFINKGQKFVLLNSDTGTGKSWIAWLVGMCVNTFERINSATEEEAKEVNSLYLTKTISLQHQYHHDFKNMKLLKSASNYSCHTTESLPINPKLKVHESCMFTRDSGQCLYSRAKSDFNRSDMRLLNYAYFLAFQRNSISPMSSTLLVVDEAHTLPSYLIDFSSIELNFDILSKHAAMTKDVKDYFPLGHFHRSDFLQTEDLKKILDYCFDASSDLDERIMSVMDEMEGASGHSVAELIERSLKPLNAASNYFTDLGGKLYLMLNSTNPDNWVQEKCTVELQTKTNEIFEFKSLEVDSTMLNIIHENSKYVLLMSGTCGRLIKDLNIGEDNVAVMSSPYVFPIENRPFISMSDLPPLNYSTRDTVIPNYLKRIDELLDMMPDDSGLIHSVSYTNANYIKENSRHKNRIYIPNKEELRDIKSVVQKGRVLISPAMIEGIDLKGDAANFQIFIKVPYPSLGSKWMKKKVKMDQDWYNFETLVSIQQGSGRAIRCAEDVAVTFMLDPAFRSLYQKTKQYIPSWFDKTIVWN